MAGFVRRAWHVLEPGMDYVHGWHIDAVAEHLTAITDGQISRLLINVPPGMMKSLLVGVLWPAWEWGPRNRPSTRVVATSHSIPLAVRDNLKARRLVQSDWYQALWGDRVKLTGDQNAKTKFENTATGFRDAMAFRSLTGSRGDRVVIDDPHSVDGAESEAERSSVTQTFLESVPTRLNDPKRSAIVVVMQRLHERDVSGVAIAKGLGYEHLCLPMEFEPERRCRTSIGFADPRTEDGELLFAHEAFARGVSRGFHAVLVDYPSLNPRATRAEERAAGARPFFVHVPAESFLALYTRRDGGREIVEHARFREDVVERVGFGEELIRKIRVLEPGRWELWRQDPQSKKWSREKVGLISRGSQRLQSVPLAFFRTGERLGELRVKPPLIELAQMQVELFRALSRQDEVLTFAGSPMLKARGMNPPPGAAPTPVGPRRVLWAPPSGTGTDAGPQPDWDYIQPEARNIEQIRKHVDSVIDDMRRLGMQPMIQRTGTTTATGDKIEAARAHSALQAWAMGLKDCLEQAMVFAAEWTNEAVKAEVDVYTDFSAVPFAQAPLIGRAARRHPRSPSPRPSPTGSRAPRGRSTART